MKRPYIIFIFMLIFNAVTWWSNFVPIFAESTALTPFNNTQLITALNGTATATNWDAGTAGLFGDVKAGMVEITKLTEFATGFSGIWGEALGSIDPSHSLTSVWLFIDAMMIIWTVIFWLLFVDIITGGRIFGSS